MNSQDQRKNHTPGHENLGVHVCHKCGWSFPNPHPSAKHRRAHKKNCGKIEGFKLIDSEEKTHLSVSDEEQLSDEDHKSPGNSKLEEPRNNEQMKSGIRRQESNRLEEEVFSDAVAEFGDAGTSPAVETSVGTGAGEPDVNVEANERQLTLSVKASSGTNIVQAAEYPSHGTQIQGPQALESSVDNYESNIPFQDHTSSSTIGPLVASLSYRETESLAVELMDDRCDSACFITPVEHEIPVNVFSENTNTKFGVNVMDGSLTNIGKDTDAQENKKSNIDGNFPPMAVSPSKPANVASEIDSKLREMNTDPVDRLVDSKEEEIDALGARLPQIDPSPFSAQVDSCNLKEKGYENKPALSTDMPAEGHSEMTVKDFKDHGPVTSDIYLTPVCGQVIKEMDDHPKNPASEEVHLGFLSCKPDEGADISSAKQVLKENLQQEGTGSNSMTSDIYLPPGSVQLTKEMDDHPKNPASEEIHLGFQSCNSEEGGNISSSAKQVLEENLQQDGTGSSSVVEEPVTSDIYLTPVCAQVIKEMDDHPKNPASEEAHLGFLSCKPNEGADVSSAKQVLKENLQQEGTGSNSVTSDTYLPPGCVQVTKEMDDHPKNPASEEIHLGFQSCNSNEGGNVSSSAKQVLEENLQQDGTGSSSVVEEPVTSDIYLAPICAQVIKDMDDHPKNPASEEVHSGFLSCKPDEGADVSSAKQVLKEHLQQEGTGSNGMTSDIYLPPGCVQVTKEMDDHPKIPASKEIHLDFQSCNSEESGDVSSSAKQVLEENLQKDGTGSNILVEEPVTSDIYQTPGCDQIIKDMDNHPKNPASEEVHSGFLSYKTDEGADVSSSAKQVLEENLQLEGTGSNSVIEEPVTSDIYLTPGCGQVIKEMDDHPKNASEEVHMGFLSCKSDEGTDLSSSSKLVLEENLQQEGTGSNGVVEEPVTSDIYLTPGCGQVLKEMDEHPKNASKELHSGFLSCKSDEGADVTSSVKQVLEENLQQEAGRKSMVEEVCIKHKTDLSDSTGAGQVLEENLQQERTGSNSLVEEVCIKHKTDRYESKACAGNGSDGLEVFSDAISSNLALIHPEKSQAVCSIEKQESYDSHLVLSQVILPEKLTVSQAGGVAKTSPLDADIHEPNNAFSSGTDVPEKDRNGNSDIAGNYGEGAIEEDPTTNTRIAPEFAADVSKTELHVHAYNEIGESEGKLQESESTHLDTVVDSCLQNVTELHSDLQDCPDEDFQGSSKEHRVSSSIDSSVKKTEIQVDKVSEFLHEETKFDDNIVGSLQSGAENVMFNEHMPSATDIASCILTSVTVDNNSAKDICGDASDIKSQSLQDNGDNNLVKQQLGSSAVVLANVPVNSTGQIDCMERYPGSVSDGTVASTRDATDEAVIPAAETLQETDTQVLEKEAQEAEIKNSLGVNSSTKDFGGGASDISSQSLQDEGDNSLLNQQPNASAVVPRDISIDSNSQTDSVEGYWGSVSDGTLPSMRYTTEEPAILATQALQTSDTQGAKDEAQNSNLKNKIGASKEHCSDNSDMFEAPSFMTLVEPGKGNYRQAPSSEIQTVQNPQQPNSSSVQAGWFPSLTHVVKESQGRKKNEEIIAKVSNWSSGKPHTPLKSLLVEANLESKQKALNAQGRPALATNKDEVSAQDNGLPAKTLPLITAPKVSATRSAKGDAEREWNSPATLPDNKREGRKVRGKQYWVPFVCCASLNEDH